MRNTLLSKAVDDIDIATRHTPQRVMDLCGAAGIKTIPTGLDHGTVTAVIDKQSFEITTLRRDVETDGRRAVVAYTDDWAQDAARRDFTMNTLLMDMAGNIYDPTGEGLDDLNARRVVFVGDPAGRIAEDILRILRFFRFHAYYGAGDPDAAALKAICAAADKIPTLSRERITQEVFKILSLDDPADVLSLMFACGVMSDLAHEHYSAALMRRVCAAQSQHKLQSLAARLIALGGVDASHLNTLERYLIIPKTLRKGYAAIHHVLALPALSNDHNVKVAVYKYGLDAAAHGVIIACAHEGITQGRINNAQMIAALDVVQNWSVPVCPVNGQDLLDAGMLAGKALGDDLSVIERRWIDGGFTATKNELLNSKDL